LRDHFQVVCFAGYRGLFRGSSANETVRDHHRLLLAQLVYFGALIP